MSQDHLDWETQRVFLAVLRAGSLSAAGRALALAQPTVRRRLDALEVALGVALFTRSPSGLTPTEAARRLIPHAEAMAAAADAFARASSAGTRNAGGVVRITTSHVVGAEVLPDMLAALGEEHPEITFELVLSNRTQDLLRQEADIAVRMVKPVQASLITRKAGVIRLGAFASRAYVERHGKPRTVADAPRFHWIGPDRDETNREMIAALGLGDARVWRVRTDHHLAQLAAVRAGLGIGVIQSALARRMPALVQILPDDFGFDLHTWVVMHEDLKRVPHVRATFDHLVRALGRYAALA